MPKLKSPMWSAEAIGTLGGFLVFFRSKGMNIVRANMTMKKSNTAQQQTVRSYFKSATVAWAALTSGNKTTWNDYATAKGDPAISGYNWFIGKYFDYMQDNAGVDPTAPFLPA